MAQGAQNKQDVRNGSGSGSNLSLLLRILKSLILELRTPPLKSLPFVNFVSI